MTPWQRALAALAVAKVFAGVVAFVAAFFFDAARVTARDFLMMAHVVVFGTAALALIAGTRRDRRAILLGIAFLIPAAVFAKNGLVPFTRAGVAVPTFMRALAALPADAFSPWLLWLFVEEFPRVAPFGPRHSVPRAMVRVSLVAGIVLFVANIAYFVATLRPEYAQWQRALWPVASANNAGAYWTTEYALSLLGFVALLWKSRVAELAEKRRVSLLVAGLVVGSAPTALWVFLVSFSPAVNRVLPLSVAGWVIYPTLLSTPFSTAYAVLVQRALDVRLVVRRAMQYALARYSVLVAAAIPIAIIGITLYQQRASSVQQLVSGLNGVMLASLAVLALVASRSRRGVLENLDRRFFREQYDSRKILGELVEQCKNVTGRHELAELLHTEIGRALHPDSMRVLFVDDARRSFTSPRRDVRPLEASAPLVSMLARSGPAVDIDLERDDDAITSLPGHDRYWLVDGGVRLLLALKDAEQAVVGIVALGEKRSELPYSTEDRLLLSTVASAASLSLAYLSVHPRLSAGALNLATAVATEEPASECPACGGVFPAGTARCERCGAYTEAAPVPFVVAGKFRITDRLGAGGMGVVYKGLDLQLDRPVAVKTLPQMSPDEAMRLRREARAMAAVSHPNLALIYGSESWTGIPMLIVEFLAGGTLDARLTRGPMPIDEALELGATLADVIGGLHRTGILHRDIKPSNIGFTASGTPKLLDFGLARLLSGPVPERGGYLGASTGERRAEVLASRGSLENLRLTATEDGHIVGTPLYLSPEAVAGKEPDPSFDVWSTCVVLFEAIAGRNPAEDATMMKTLIRIESCTFPDLRDFVPDAPPSVAAFFRRAFSPDPSQRPRTADALRTQLRRERQELERAVATTTA